MRKITLDVFFAELDAQNNSMEKLVFVCPMCGTPQCAQDLIDAGAGDTFDDVEKFIGFSCVGRWTGGKSPRKRPDGQPCNWTLGGLFSFHKLVVVTPDGRERPHFEVATPEQASAHHAARKNGAK